MGNLQGRPAGRPCNGQIIFWKIPLSYPKRGEKMLNLMPLTLPRGNAWGTLCVL